MPTHVDAETIADQLMRAADERTLVPLPSETVPGFDVDRAYDVLFAIDDRRRARGWSPVGWKIGFTNRTLWPR